MRLSSTAFHLSAIAAVLIGGVASASGAVAQTRAGTWVTPQGLELLPVLGRAHDVGPADPDEVLVVAVSFPYARPREMQAFVDSVSDPKSPNYRRFITPEEVGERFGLSLARVTRVADYLREHGFTITEIGRNRLSLVARGTLAHAEQAFHTTIRSYTAEPTNEHEPRQFRAPSTLLRLPDDMAGDVIDVCGLDSFTQPQPLLTPDVARTLYNTAPIYDGGMTGAGRVIGVSNFSGFEISSALLYISHFGLPVPAGGAGSNIVVVPVAGGGCGATTPQGEGDTDIQMGLGMAPLATIRVYDSPVPVNLVAVLTAEANDNECDGIAEGYGWPLTDATANACHNLHLSMSAEGITYMAAAGDHGTNIEPFDYPQCEPEVLVLGGTVAHVDANGHRINEINWTAAGSGWSTNTFAFNVRPPYQMSGTGIPAINAVNNKRLVPDLAFHSSSSAGAYQFYFNGMLTSNFIGTSFASSAYAGMLQEISLKTISLGGLVPDGSGHRRFGRMQDLIYGQNNDPAIWYDIVTGLPNGNLPSNSGPSTPHVGWDTAVGWGPMDCDAFAAAVVCDTGGCPIVPYCFGDGNDPNVSTICPCFNFGALGHGCANAIDVNGGVLACTGGTSPDTILLSASNELPSSLSIFLQGTASNNAGILFGDGVRCAAGSLKRLFTHNASGGNVSAPSGGDATVSQQSANLGAPIVPGSTRYYQTYYRDPHLAFCSGLGFNVTNGIRIQW